MIWRQKLCFAYVFFMFSKCLAYKGNEVYGYWLRAASVWAEVFHRWSIFEEYFFTLMNMNITYTYILSYVSKAFSSQ